MDHAGSMCRSGVSLLFPQSMRTASQVTSFRGQCDYFSGKSPFGAVASMVRPRKRSQYMRMAMSRVSRGHRYGYPLACLLTDMAASVDSMASVNSMAEGKDISLHSKLRSLSCVTRLRLLLMSTPHRYFMPMFSPTHSIGALVVHFES